VRPVHADKGVHSRAQSTVGGQRRGRTGRSDAADLVGQQPPALVLRAQRADQIDQRARRFEAREEILFFEPLVVVLDEAAGRYAAFTTTGRGAASFCATRAIDAW